MKKILTIVIIVVIIGLLAGALYYWFWLRSVEPEQIPVDNGTPQLPIVQPSPKGFSYLTDGTSDINKADIQRVFEGDKYIFRIAAQLPDPAANSYYEAWLSKSGGADAVSVGKLYLLKGPAGHEGDRYYLSYTSDIDYWDYLDIFVTLETDDDPAPGQKILTGKFSDIKK